jgi:hypothetical protein
LRGKISSRRVRKGDTQSTQRIKSSALLLPDNPLRPLREKILAKT